MKYKIKFTNQFKRDFKLAKKQNKDLSKLRFVIEKLARGERLDAKYRDHELAGRFSGIRECHIEPNWLLMYEYIKDQLILTLLRTGSHSELFGK